MLPMLLFATLTVASPTDGSDWPAWGGPSRDHISPEEGWSAHGSPEPVWSRNVGIGYTAVSIQGDRLLTAGFTLKEGDRHSAEAEAAGTDTVLCLDPETGEEIWSYSYPATLDAQFHGGGTRTSLCVDDDVAYFTNRVGKTICFDLDSGEIRWQRDYLQELGLKKTYHGFSGSPIRFGDDLFLNLGGTTVAVDPEQGDVRWQTKDYGDGSYASPVVFETDRGLRLAIFNGDGLSLLDARDGRSLAEFPFRSTRGGVNAGNPVIIGGDVFISSAYNMGCALLRIDDDSLDVRWRHRRMRNKVSGTVLWKDHLYGFDESMLKCLDLEGKEKWRQRGLGMGSLIASDDKLIIMSSRGDLIIAAATPEEYRELSKSKVLDDGVYWTTPVLAHGRIYCRNSLGDTVCLDHTGGIAPPTANASAESNLPDAKSLFQRHLEAIGGADAVNAHESVRMTGTIEILSAGATISTMTWEQKAPNKSLLSYLFPQFGEARECFDGEMAWFSHPFEDDTIHEGERLLEWRERADFYDAVRFEANYPQMKTTGQVTVADIACYRVDARSHSGKERTFYFDIQSGLRRGMEGEGEALVLYDEYREFDGVHIPTRWTFHSPGTDEERNIVIETVTFDVVEDAAFEPIPSIQWLMKSPEEVEAIHAPLREKYQAILGTYEGKLGTRSLSPAILLHRGHLAVDMFGGSPMQVNDPDENGKWTLAISNDVFVEFEMNEHGRAKAFTFTQPGMTVTSTRKAGSD